MSQKYLNLKQHRWLKLLKDYDLIIDFYPRKANAVANALSRKYLFALRALNTQLTLINDGFILDKLKQVYNTIYIYIKVLRVYVSTYFDT